MKPLYRGTIYEFDNIDVSVGKGYKDFGKGFYATADAETTTIINEYYDELEESGYSDEICEKVIAELKPENLPKQYFFRTPEAVKTLSFGKVKRQVIG